MFAFTESAIFMSLATLASAQMVVFDTSKDFDIRCDARSYCLTSGSHSAFSFGPTYPQHIERDDRYEDQGLEGYHFLEPGAFIKGAECTTSEADGSCTATCDAAACVCLVGIIGDSTWTDPPVDGTNCTILEELPDSNVASPSELVIYESSTNQLPDGRIKLRCKEHLAVCTTPMVDAKDGSYFAHQYDVADFPDYYFAMDYSDCRKSDDNSTCYMACDPTCECTMEVNNETATCLIKAPAESPTTMLSMMVASRRTMVSIALAAAWTIAAVYGCILVSRNRHAFVDDYHQTVQELSSCDL